jgi:hypothetical protein
MGRLDTEGHFQKSNATAGEVVEPAKEDRIKLPLVQVNNPYFHRSSAYCLHCSWEQDDIKNKQQSQRDIDEAEANKQLEDIIENIEIRYNFNVILPLKAEIERLKAKDSEWYDYTKKLIAEHKQAIREIFEELEKPCGHVVASHLQPLLICEMCFKALRAKYGVGK